MECIVCGAEMRKTHELRGGDIYICGRCRLHRADCIQYIEKASNEREEHLLAAMKDLRIANYKKVLSALQDLRTAEKMRGLDVGCAQGWFMEESIKEGIEIQGIEPEHEFYMQAREKGLHVKEGFFPQDIVLSERYDFITFNDVFEHLPAIDDAISACKSLLKPHGYVVITCPCSEGIFFRVSSLLAKIGINSFLHRLWQFDFYTPHLWYFNQKNLDAFMRRHGFKRSGTVELPSFSTNGLKERVIHGSNHKIMSYIVYFALRMGYPILQKMASDILCHIYQMDSNEVSLR